ncbi:helix-turn-helix transcriptional regulator [Paracoccus fontiphilus]|uniref:Helix-turn-helix transcriptional regulator n=1 Tax=Paracoccus fontiphilus TaxID=1815556 RepID=A0ABV7ICP7_9RHOB|nr:hypothetical protein [Paracoccus fontiphilus]
MQADRRETRLIPTSEMPFSRMTLWRLPQTDPSFPKPIKIGNRNYYRSDEYQQWIEEKSAERAA